MDIKKIAFNQHVHPAEWTPVAAMIVPTSEFYPMLREEEKEQEEAQCHDLEVILPMTFFAESNSSLSQIFLFRDWVMHDERVAIGPIHIQFDDAMLVRFDP